MTPTAFTGKAVRLAFVGRIIQDKGGDGFLKLVEMAEFPRIDSITIFGEGPERSNLERKYQRLTAGGKIVFAGNLQHGRLLSLLLEHDALVIPSIWYENAPLIIVEAAMLGLPILAHDIGSIAAFGDEIGNKILYKNNMASLTESMDKLVEQRRTRREPYDVSAYDAQRYADSVRMIMRL
jgi:glycosyltransferase involved in cell wall biosynthesis